MVWQTCFYGLPLPRAQDLRDATAQHFMDLQKAALVALPPCTTLIIEIALDETEQAVRLDAPSETASAIVIHVKTFRRRGDQVQSLDLVLPSGVVESTGCNALLAALESRLPLSLATFRQTAQRIVVVLNTDSAHSCLKLGRHLNVEAPCLAAPCRTHQLCICIVSVLRLGGIMSPMFCGSIFLHRRRVQAFMRRRLKEHINASLKIEGQVIAILDLMEGMITERTLPGACTRRLAAFRRLKAFFCGPLRGTKDIHHYCPLGCHSSREAAATELYEDLLEVFLSHPPAVPAYNKWTKIWPPLVWFASFLCLHDILPTIVDEMCSLIARVSGEGWDFADEGLDEEQMIGLEGEQSFRRQDQARFRKTRDWLTSAVTPDKMIALSVVLRPSLDVLGHFFSGARRYEKSSAYAILPLIKEGESPVTNCIETYLQMLGDSRLQAWMPLVGAGQPWNNTSYVLASVPAWLMAAKLFRRLVLGFRRWPWRLGALISEDTSDAEKQELASEFFRCRPCCLDSFSAKLRGHFASSADLLSEGPDGGVQFLRDLFEHTLSSNIHSENRFSRCSRHQHSSHGNPAKPSTLASNHVLAEPKTVLDTHVAEARCAMHGQGAPAAAAAKAQGSRSHTWRNFVRQHRRDGSMAALATRWHGVPEEERAAYMRTDCAAGDASQGAGSGQAIPPPLRVLFPGCAEDEYYPVGACKMQEVTENVASLSKRWAETVGSGIIRPKCLIDAPVAHVCEDAVGQGRCKTDRPSGELAQLDACKARLSSWSRMTRAKDAAWDAAWGCLPLFFLGPGQGVAGRSDEPMHGLLMLLLASEFRPPSQIFYVDQCARPAPGDILSFTQLAPERILDHVETSRPRR